MRKSIALLLGLAAMLVAFGCSELGPAEPGGPDGVVKAEDVTGNCLSFPVLWAEGVSVPLRGTFGETTFLGASTLVDGVEVFHQHDPLNEWQAASADVSAEPLHVDWIDWGDNIESRAWPDKSKIRVEVVLYQDLDTPLTGYEMIWVSGLGIDEMWGTNTLTYDSYQATVYSQTARMTIQKLTIPDPDQADLTWDPVTTQWVGDVSEPFYNSAVFDEGESPIERYAAEINVKGKVIYGTLWDTRTHGDGPGVYRLTFSFDGLNATVPNNAFFDEFTEILVPVEETEKAEPVGGTTHIDVANNLTWVDLPITATSGSGHNRPDSPGNGGGGGGGGAGHGGGGGGRN